MKQLRRGCSIWIHDETIMRNNMRYFEIETMMMIDNDMKMIIETIKTNKNKHIILKIDDDDNEKSRVYKLRGSHRAGEKKMRT